MSGPVYPPRVFLHDSSFTRLGRLSNAANVSRSYTIDSRDVATMDVGFDEPLLYELRPALGRVIVIESSSYALPWVGKIVAIKGDQARRTLTVNAKGYSSIFDNRILGPQFTARGAADSIINQALREVNSVSETGVIWAGGSAGEAILQLNAPSQKCRVVFDRAARFGGLEWYIDAEPSPDNILLKLLTPKWRGLDRYTEVKIQDGVSGDLLSWKEDAEAAAFALVVVSAFDAATQSVNDRPISRIAEEAQNIDAPHGYAIDGSEIASTILTRNERAIVSEELKAAGSAAAAADAILAREGGVVRRSLSLNVTDVSLWSSIQPGDVVRVASKMAFLQGWDGPVRVQAVQPDEERGKLKAAVRLLRKKDTTT